MLDSRRHRAPACDAAPARARAAADDTDPASGGSTGPAPTDVAELITSHLPLVGHVARETAARMPRHLGTDDLIGAGSLALVQAAHSFDPAHGVPFARFANTRIRGAMIDQMRQRDWATRSLRSRARSIAAAAETLTTALGRAPSDEELAAAASMTVAELRAVQAGTDKAVLLSLDPIGPDDEGLGAGIADPGPRPEEALIAAERRGYLRDAIAELPERLREVVTRYYVHQQPLTEIAELLGVTQSRASQLRSEGLDLLREALQELWQVTPAGPQSRPARQPQPSTEQTGAGGVRARRRQAYVSAVAARSSVAARADVDAYLDAAPLHDQL